MEINLLNLDHLLKSDLFQVRDVLGLQMSYDDLYLGIVLVPMFLPPFNYPRSSYTSGCCACCLCSGPLYTCNFLAILRPKEFFGSIPATAISTIRSGNFSIISAALLAFNPPG